MPFNYYETYRTEAADETLSFPVLRGASSLAGRRWVFYAGSDSHSVSMPSFTVLSAVEADDGSIDVKVDNGDPKNPLRIKFIPLTVEYVRANPGLYNLSESALRLLGDPGMKELLFTGLIPEWYAEKFGPPEEIEEAPSGG